MLLLLLLLQEYSLRLHFRILKLVADLVLILVFLLLWDFPEMPTVSTIIILQMQSQLQEPSRLKFMEGKIKVPSGSQINGKWIPLFQPTQDRMSATVITSTNTFSDSFLVHRVSIPTQTQALPTRMNLVPPRDQLYPGVTPVRRPQRGKTIMRQLLIVKVVPTASIATVATANSLGITTPNRLQHPKTFRKCAIGYVYVFLPKSVIRQRQIPQPPQVAANISNITMLTTTLK